MSRVLVAVPRVRARLIMPGVIRGIVRMPRLCRDVVRSMLIFGRRIQGRVLRCGGFSVVHPQVMVIVHFSKLHSGKHALPGDSYTPWGYCNSNVNPLTAPRLRRDPAFLRQRVATKTEESG
jgi:hypothetical protein